MALTALVRTPKIGAFFDMDKTIIAENSGSLYMKYRYQHGEISGWDLAKGLAAYLQYKADILDIAAWTKNTMVQFRGQSERALTREANRWFRDMVADTIYPEAEAIIREHLVAGHVVAIVSGSTKFVVKPLAERLGIRHFLYTRLQVLRAVAEGAARGQVIKEVVPAGAAETPRVAEGEAGYQAPGLAFGPVAAGDAKGDMSRMYVSPVSGPEVRAPGVAAPGGHAVLGQYANMYIVAADADGLLVIDQHNAHERVLFDKFREIDRQDAWPRKTLLIPPILELSPSAAAALEANALLFEELGFRVEAMGRRSYALKEYPDLFMQEDAGDVFQSMLEEAGEKPAEERRDHMLATMACKSAVKAGKPLAREKMEYLVEELFKTTQPALCPHGRPIVVRIEKPTIGKGLGRRH